MLILTRCIGESLIIGDDISVSVLTINDNQVRIGTSAPKHVAVHREDVYHRISENPCPMNAWLSSDRQGQGT